MTSTKSLLSIIYFNRPKSIKLSQIRGYIDYMAGIKCVKTTEGKEIKQFSFRSS